MSMVMINMGSTSKYYTWEVLKTMVTFMPAVLQVLNMKRYFSD